MKSIVFNTLEILWLIIFMVLGCFGLLSLIEDFKDLCKDELILIRNVFKKK